MRHKDYIIPQARPGAYLRDSRETRPREDLAPLETMSDDLQREILSEVDGLCHLRGQVLFEREKKILDLYNEQQEVRLEVALLNAQNKCGIEFLS